MIQKVGFIGSGNIASAIIGGIISSGFLKPENISVSSLHKNTASTLSSKYGVILVNDNIELVKSSDVVVLSVKPNTYGTVLKKIKSHVKDEAVIVTVAAGITIDYVKNHFDREIKVIRTMPNTPAMVGEGMTAMTYDQLVNELDVSFVKGMFESCGIVEVIEDEALMDVVTSLGSSSPAFVDILIEAMADAAVLLGLPRVTSYRMAAQAVKGSARMLMETGKHPGELKDMVCSPGGTAIEGVRVLEEKGMRIAMIEAIIATAEKAKLLGEKYK
jgi:pyrroline-5-carboxylate reductase